MQAKLAELVDAIPSLGRLPPDALERLDITELRVPSGRVAEKRAAMERELGCHIVVYERTQSGPRMTGALHLCSIAAAARLTPQQLRQLLAAEAALELEHVSLVAYESLHHSLSAVSKPIRSEGNL
ncbi:MAG TPA: hypothetical protein VJ806_14090 [Luteimonas sp.]|nr:hypothetical protein [Luteimonas sp.]